MQFVVFVFSQWNDGTFSANEQRNWQSARLRSQSKQVRTPIALLRSLSDKYPWERHEPPYIPRYGSNSITAVIFKDRFVIK